MAAKKLIRDSVLLGQPLHLLLSSQPQASSSRLRLITAGGHPCNRRYSVLSDFSKKYRGEVSSNPEFRKSVKQLKEKAEELQGMKGELKFRTKQTTGQLYKHVDSISTVGKARTKKAKEQFGMGKPEESASASSSTKHDAHAIGGNDGKSAEEKCKQAGSDDNTVSSFEYRTTSFFYPNLEVHILWTPRNLKGVKLIDLAKKGYRTVGGELSGSPSKREHKDHAPTMSTRSFSLPKLVAEDREVVKPVLNAYVKVDMIKVPATSGQLGREGSQTESPPPIERNPLESVPCGDGGMVSLVGVEHDSKESQMLVKRVINDVLPKAVFVELCSGREELLYDPTSEFFVARKEAKKIGARLYLGDEHILINDFKEHVLIPPEEFMRVKYSGLPFEEDMDPNGPELLELARKSCPTFVKIVIDDRNLFMMRKLRDVLRKHGRVVAVVGSLHVSGMGKLLSQEGVAVSQF